MIEPTLEQFGTTEEKHSQEKKEKVIKEQFAELAILVWIIYGLYTLFFHPHLLNGIRGTLLYLLLYYTVGIFIAGIASIVTYLLEHGVQYIFASFASIFNERSIVNNIIGIFMFFIFPILSIIVQIIWIYYVSNYFINLIGRF